MSGRQARSASLAVTILLALALSGCIALPAQTESGRTGSYALPGGDTPACEPAEDVGGGAGGSQGEGSQAGVSNQPGAFSYGGQAMAKTSTETYVWQNPAPRAAVNWGGQSMTGSFELVLLDACGQEVYRASSSSMRQGGTSETTGGGTGGAWTVRLEFTAYSGQMGLSITSA